MDALTFIVEIVKALGWPVAAIILVMMLRKEIKALLPLVKRLKAGPVEAEFDREVKELKETAEAQLQPVVRSQDATTQRQKLLQLIEVNPRSAVIEAWQCVEFAARRFLQSQNGSITEREPQSPVALLRGLNRYEVLTRDEVALFNDLRSLRNEAVHRSEFVPTYESVLNYIDLAARLQAVIELRSPNLAQQVGG